MWDNSGRLGADINGAHVFVLLVKEYPWASSIPFCCSGRGAELTGKSEGLTLTDGTMELRADFGRMLPRLKQGRLQQELLVKAARAKGIERPWAIDAHGRFW